MIKENITIIEKKFGLNITNSKIDSVINKEIKKNGIRIYNHGLIGISGYLGNKHDKTAEKKAITALENNIKYPYKPAENVTRSEEYGDFLFSPNSFIEEIETILEIIKKEFPGFSLSHKAYMEEYTSILENTRDTKMSSKLKFNSFEFIYNKKGSGNIMDGYVLCYGNDYNRETLLDYFREILTAHDNILPLPEGKIPVLFDNQGIIKIFNKDLSAHSFGTGSSLFSDDLNKKVFSEKFNLVNSRKKENYATFFDSEGVVLDNDEFYLIENGVVKSAYTDKKTASKYGYKLTGNGSSSYDTVPSLSSSTIQIKESEKTLKELIGNQPAIYVMMASGGDYDASGNFASPVQAGFLYENGKIKGRLPEFTISSNVYDLFGNDFIGLSSDSLLSISNNRTLALKMDIKK